MVVGLGTASVPRLPVDPAGPTLAESAYRRLRADLISGSLGPAEPLRLDALSQRYGVGLSPLREALFRLTAERLVTAEGFRGFRAASISAAEAEDVTRVRILLETVALRDSIAQADDGWEEEVVAAHHSLQLWTQNGRGADEEGWAERHRRFHRALVAGCGSPWTMNLIDLLFDQSERYRQLRFTSGMEPNLIRDVQAEHRTIAERALARDAEGAAAALTQHYQRTLSVVQHLATATAEE